jgi:hypothetical protein
MFSEEFIKEKKTSKITVTNVLPAQEWKMFLVLILLKTNKYEKNASKEEKYVGSNLEKKIEDIRKAIEEGGESFNYVVKMQLRKILNDMYLEASKEKESAIFSLLTEISKEYKNAITEINKGKQYRIVDQLINPEDFKNSDTYQIDKESDYFWTEKKTLEELNGFKFETENFKNLKAIFAKIIAGEIEREVLTEFLKKILGELEKNKEIAELVQSIWARYEKDLSYKEKTSKNKLHPEHDISRIALECRFNKFLNRTDTFGLQHLKKLYLGDFKPFPPRGEMLGYSHEKGLPALVRSHSIKSLHKSDPFPKEEKRASNEGKILTLPRGHSFIFPEGKNDSKETKIKYYRRGHILNGQYFYWDNKLWGVEPGFPYSIIDDFFKKLFLKVLGRTWAEVEKTKLSENIEEINLSEDELKKLYEEIKKASEEYWEAHILLKQDYNDGVFATITYEGALGSNTIKKIPKLLQPVAAKAYQEFRKQTKNKTNIDAAFECAATNIATDDWLLKGQRQTLTEGTYLDGHSKIMTCSGLEKKLKTFSDSDGPFEITGGTSSNGNYIVEKGKRKTTDKILNFFEYFILFVLGGDFDGLKDANKGTIPTGDTEKFNFFGIDFGHAFRGKSPLIQFLEDNLRVSSSKGFKNFSILDDSLLKERMKGIHYLRALLMRVLPEKDVLESYDQDFKEKIETMIKNKNANLKIWNDFIEYFHWRSVLAKEEIERQDFHEIAVAFKEAKSNYLNDCNKVLDVFKPLKYKDTFSTPRYHLTVSELTLLDNLEKLLSETETHSPDGIELQHLRIADGKRIPCQLIKPINQGEDYKFVTRKHTQNEVDTLKEYLKDSSLLDLVEIENIDGVLTMSVAVKNFGALLRRIDENDIKKYKEKKKLSKSDIACINYLNKSNGQAEALMMLKGYVTVQTVPKKAAEILRHIKKHNIVKAYMETLPKEAASVIYKSLEPYIQEEWFCKGLMSIEGEMEFLLLRYNVFLEKKRESWEYERYLQEKEAREITEAISKDSSKVPKQHIEKMESIEDQFILATYMKANLKPKKLIFWGDVIKGIQERIFKSEYLASFEKVFTDLFALKETDLKELSLFIKDLQQSKLDSNMLLLDAIKIGFSTVKSEDITSKKLATILHALLDNLQQDKLDTEGKADACNFVQDILHCKDAEIARSTMICFLRGKNEYVASQLLCTFLNLPDDREFLEEGRKRGHSKLNEYSGIQLRFHPEEPKELGCFSFFWSSSSSEQEKQEEKPLLRSSSINSSNSKGMKK